MPRSRLSARAARLATRRGKKKGKPHRPPAPAPVVLQVTATYLQAQVGPKVALYNQSRYVRAEDLAPTASALARQVNEQFGQPSPVGFGLGISGMRVATDADPPRPGEWVLLLTDSIDEPGAYGYHDEDGSGGVIIRCFPRMDAEDGNPWSVTASHELLETLLDPDLDQCVIGQDGVVRAREACDPVEADRYQIDGVWVSNFLCPGWFGTVPGAVRFDWMGSCVGAYEIRPGGYQYILDGGEWVDVRQGAHRGARARTGSAGVSRGARRRAKLPGRVWEGPYPVPSIGAIEGSA